MRRSATSSGFKSLGNLYDRMSMLYDGGLIVFTKERLVSSGIWSEAEAERIMNDPVISFQAKESIRRFMDYYSSPEESLGIRPEVSRTDHNGRRGDIRILFYGQGEKPDDTRNHNRDGNYGGQYGAFYKCSNFHCS